MQCPQGTSFNLTDCACSNFVAVTNRTETHPCLLYLPFDNDIADHSVNEFATFESGEEHALSIDNTTRARGVGSLSFAPNKTGWVEVPGLQALSFGQKGSWCLFYRYDSSDSIINVVELISYQMQP